MIWKYFLIIHLQFIKIFLLIKKSIFASILKIQKNIFFYQLFLKILVPFSWKKRIILLELDRNYEEVIARCKKRMKRDKKNERYICEIIARNYRNLNKIDDALDYITKAKKLNNNSGSIDYEQGLIYFIKRKYSKARESLELAIKKGHNTAPLQIHLGKIYYQLGLNDKAELCFRRVLSIFPKEGSIYFLLGIVLKNKMRFNEAEIAFLKAIEHGSDHKEEHLGLAEIYTRKGDWKKAIQEYKQITIFDPGSFVAHYFLGIIYEMLGRDTEAINELILANKINPEDEYTREKLTKLLASTP